jgi:hypothetical protein
MFLPVEGISVETLRRLRFKKLDKHVIIDANSLGDLLYPGVDCQYRIRSGDKWIRTVCEEKTKHQHFSWWKSPTGWMLNVEH